MKSDILIIKTEGQIWMSPIEIDASFLGCNTVCTWTQTPVFWSNILTPSPTLKIETVCSLKHWDLPTSPYAYIMYSTDIDIFTAPRTSNLSFRGFGLAANVMYRNIKACTCAKIYIS
jgi:hypothetical protein